MAKNKVLVLPLITFDTASLTANYQLIGTLSKAAFLINITNLGDQPVLMSFDGVNDNEIIAAFGTEPTVVQLNFQTNSQPSNYCAALAAQTNIYVKWEAGFAGIGNLYISAYYQDQGA